MIFLSLDTLVILGTVMYLNGLVLNVMLLLLTCRKDFWQNSGNIKYLIATQAVFSFVTIACELVPIDSFPRCFCVVLPGVMMYSLSLVIFNLTALAVVKYAQVTKTWQLRHSSIFFIFAVMIVFSWALLAPVWLTALVGRPIVVYDIHPCTNKTSLRVLKERVSFYNDLNIASYLSFFLLIQYIIPVIIILNRFLLLGFYMMKKENEQDVEQPKSHGLSFQTAVEIFINTMSFIIFMYISYHFYRGHTDVKILNDVFHHLANFITAVLIAFPILLWITNISCQESKVEQQSSKAKLTEEKQVDA